MRFESVALGGDRSSFVQGEARLGRREGGAGDATSFGDWKLGETIGPNRGTIPIVGGDDFNYTRIYT